jgi:hypothetical protein
MDAVHARDWEVAADLIEEATHDEASAVAPADHKLAGCSVLHLLAFRSSGGLFEWAPGLHSLASEIVHTLRHLRFVASGGRHCRHGIRETSSLPDSRTRPR